MDCLQYGFAQEFCLNLAEGIFNCHNLLRKLPSAVQEIVWA